MSQASKLVLFAALFAAAVGSSSAQDDPPRVGRMMQSASANGGVTGRVICADTQHAARFANVMLIPVEEVNSSGRDREFNGRRSGARTDLEGMFTATNVQPGDYYVSASATGYVSEGALLAAAGGDHAAALAKLPTVHVNASSVSTVNVSLERGGVIAGRIQWDDGTPAAGVQVNAVAAGSNAPDLGRMYGFFGGPGGNFAQTDDRGQFRLNGLAPGSYLVRGNVQSPVPGDALGRGFAGGRQMSVGMYAPGKVRRIDAQVVTLRAGEERGDVNLTMDLNALHRVSGRVGATSGTVASGVVRLTDTQDSSLTRIAQINSDGSYLLMYVPAGSYSLSVQGASSVPGQVGRQRGSDGQNAGTAFQPMQQALSVSDGDLSGVDVTLTPAAQASK